MTTQLNALTDTLTARLGTHNRTFLVLNGDSAWDIANDLKGRDAATLLALAWATGFVNLDKWQDATRVVGAFAHDCERCTFVGRLEGQDIWVDQHNEGEFGPVVIIRRSSNPSDYAAMGVDLYATSGSESKRKAAEMVSDLLADQDYAANGYKCEAHDKRHCCAR